MKKKVSIWLSITLVFQLMLGAFTVSASAATPSDINGHWAEQTIQSWLDQGMVTGYKDGSFKPNASISRAEFIKMMNNVFKVPRAQSAKSYEDLTEQHWAYADIAAAVEAGYVSGTSETTVSPDANITRQEAAVMLVKLAKLEGNADLNFKDAADIPEWSKKAIAALVAKNFLEGDPSGNVRAKDPLKRAEAVVLIDKVSQSLETVFDQEGEYGTEDKTTIINGDVRIAAAGVTLINTEITGNLTIDEAVGEGDVYLKKVVIKGTTLVQGGGENSVHLEDTVVLRIVVDKASGKVRIVAQGATKVQQVAVQSPVKLEESQVTDSGFSNIELTPHLPEGSNVDLVGHFENVHVISANIQIKIPSGSVNQLSVGDGATGNTIALDQAASIETLVLDVVTKLIGQGTVNQAKVSSTAQASSFETAPKQTEVIDKGTATEVPTAAPEPIIVPTSNPKPTPKPTATVTPTPTASTEPTATVTPTPTASTEPTATVTPTPTASTEPTATVTPTPTASTEPTATVTPKPTASTEPTATVTPKPTASTEPTATVTPKPTASTEPTATVTPKPTASTEPTATVTPKPTASTEPTATVTPTQKPGGQLSHDATIHSLTLNEELLLTKMELDKQSELPVEGFDPTHFRYSVDLPKDKKTIKITLQVETDENARVHSWGYDRTANYDDHEIEILDGKYTIELDTDKYYSVSFYVTSESGIYHKSYELFFVGALDIQKSFKLSQYGDYYSLQSNQLKAGDLVTVTIPAQHSKTGKEVVLGSGEYSYYKHGAYDNVHVALKDFAPSSDVGELGLSIVRNGEKIYDGEYKFDLTKIAFKELPDSILNFEFLSKEEVNAFNNNALNYHMMAYEYLVKTNEKELKKLYPNAVFVKYEVEYKSYNISDLVYTYDSQKSYYTVYGGNLMNPNRYNGYSNWYDPIDNLDVYEVATGQIFRAFLYDAEENLIEAFITEFDVPEENLADHVVPLVVVTEEELEGVPVELTNIQSPVIEWQKNLNYNDSDEVIEDMSFSSDYYYYVASFDQVLDGQTIKLAPLAATGLQINALVQKRDQSNNYESNYYQDVHKKGLSLTIDSDYSYNIMFTVQNPFTKENKQYQFNLNSNQITEESLKLYSQSLHLKNSLSGDLIEVTIPGAFNTKGEDLVQTFEVSQEQSYLDYFSGLYIANTYWDLSSLYDEKTNQHYSFSHNNGKGSLVIKVIRNDSVVYNGELAFDFSPVSELKNTTIYLYNAEERKQYNSDSDSEYNVVVQYDFSAINGAAYIYPFSGFQPNVQEAKNANHFIELDNGKHINGFIHRQEGSSTHTIYDGYFVYDSNYQVLGYAPIQFQVSEPVESNSLSAKEDESLPVEDESLPVESESQPVEDESLPVESEPQPVEDEETLSVDSQSAEEDGSQPIEVESLPAESDSLPVESESLQQ